MKYSITSSLRIKEMGKICFPLGKLNFKHIGNSVSAAEVLA